MGLTGVLNGDVTLDLGDVTNFVDVFVSFLCCSQGSSFCYIGVWELQTVCVNLGNLLRPGAFRMDLLTTLTFRQPLPFDFSGLSRVVSGERKTGISPTETNTDVLAVGLSFAVAGGKERSGVFNGAFSPG